MFLVWGVQCLQILLICRYRNLSFPEPNNTSLSMVPVTKTYQLSKSMQVSADQLYSLRKCRIYVDGKQLVVKTCINIFFCAVLASTVEVAIHGGFWKEFSLPTFSLCAPCTFIQLCRMMPSMSLCWWKYPFVQQILLLSSAPVKKGVFRAIHGIVWHSITSPWHNMI